MCSIVCLRVVLFAVHGSGLISLCVCALCDGSEPARLLRGSVCWGAVCRQLPLFAAVLGGRSQLSLAEMMHRNLLQLFTHVLGILELLQPHVFHHRHTALPTILLAFFHLFRVRGSDVCCSQCVDVDTMLSGVVPITVHTWFTLVSVQQVIQVREERWVGRGLRLIRTGFERFLFVHGGFTYVIVHPEVCLSRKFQCEAY